jgi:putative transcriptional regulator
MKGRRIYNRIPLLRQERGLSRKKLAEIIGVNFQTVGYLEREQYNPSLDLALRICEYFELPVEQVFGIEPLPPLSAMLSPKRTDDNRP